MNPTFYIPIILLWVIIFINMRQEKTLIKRIISKKNGKSKEKEEMVELCKRFIDKECIIYTYNSQIEATIKDVTDGALLIDVNGEEQAINLDFVIRVREYPKKKNGKKKSVVVD